MGALNPDAHPSWWATRLSLVRRFANHLNASGVDVPVIPSGLLPARKPRAVPFIYSQDDIDALLTACDTTFGHDRLARSRVTDERIAASVRTVIGLLAATGLRTGEALRLRVDDIDPAHDLLVIQTAKSAERLVPIHPTTTAALLQYIALPSRTATHPDPHGPVFVTWRPLCLPLPVWRAGGRQWHAPAHLGEVLVPPRDPGNNYLYYPGDVPPGSSGLGGGHARAELHEHFVAELLQLIGGLGDRRRERLTGLGHTGDADTHQCVQESG